MKKVVLILLIFSLTIYLVNAQRASSVVYQTTNGCLQYVADVEGNYIPDYSYAGYGYGQVPLPEVANVDTIGPIAGDNTIHLQEALDAMGQRPLDSNGIRGALLLEAGIYRISDRITIKESGIVLRGVGQGADSTNSTILVATGTDERSLLQVGYASNVNNSWKTPIAAGTVVTNPFVPAGSRTIQVEDPSIFNVGDNIIITHPSTDEWLASINYGDTDVDDPWVPGTIDMYFNRVIRAINLDEKKITIDVPIYDHFDLALAQAIVYKYDRSAIRTNIGVENLRVHIETAGEEDEAHAKSAVRLQGVEDCWVKDITALHFTFAGVDMQTANRVTVQGCTAIEPHSIITGGRRYNFAVARLTNNILFTECHGNKGRHTFVSNGASESSGIVFYNCTSDTDFSTSEGHRRWNMGLLFDNIRFTNSETSRVIGLYNRGRFGNGHGWATTHSVMWGVRVPESKGIINQKPPLRQNYAIACRGSFSVAPPFPNHPRGFTELTYQEPIITSLYETQLNYRLNNPLPPDAPTRLSATFQSDGKIDLSWLDIASDEMGYRLEFKTPEMDDFELLTTLDANVTQYSDTPLDTSAALIQYRVSAIGQSGCFSAYSNPVSIDIATSIQDPTNLFFQLFPNPFVDSIFLKTNERIESVAVFSASGQEIAVDWLSDFSINTQTWPAGIYYVEVINEKGFSGIQKLIKSR